MPGSGRLGGQRYFSHTPASQAQVVQNVSQAMRAFWLSGQRAHFDGHNANGEKRYRTVSALQETAGRKMASMPRITPGSFIDFQVSPNVTALSPLAAAMSTSFEVKPEASPATLNAEGFLDVLSTDFARQLKDLAAVMNDLKRLAALGDLPITMEKQNTLRVRFPGLDADTVERLCDDIGIQRGIIREDPELHRLYATPVALRFPFAPASEDHEKTSTLPNGSMGSHRSDISSIEEDQALFDQYIDENPWLSTPSRATPEARTEEGYESMSPSAYSSGEHTSEDFEGLEGIYRFLEECDHLRSRSTF